MNQVIIAILVSAGFASACKGLDQTSRTKSFVGLNAELDEAIVRGEAPSFLYLQQWFKHELPVDVSKAQAGGISYRVHGNFTQATLNSLPVDYRNKLVAYLKQQQSRIAEFQANIEHPDRLNQLLKFEAAEMADILMALIEPNYQPKTKDLLAHIIAHKPIRSFIDRYSVELLEKLYARPQRSLVLGMEKERDNFAKILSRSFVTKDGATEKFRISLEVNCAKLATVLLAMTGSSGGDCKAAAQTNLSEGSSIESAVGALDDSSGRALGVFGALSAPGGFATRSTSPRLRIFGSRNPNANDPYVANPVNPAVDGGQGGAVVPNPNNAGPDNNAPVDNNNNNGGSSNNLLSLLMGLFTGMMGNSNMSLAELDESSGGFDLVPPAKPRGLCLGLSGLDLVVCQRYVETLPVSLGDRRADDDKSSTFSLDSDGVTPNTSGYNFFLISKYATRVQNQGSEGACTAFGMAHTLGILARIKGKTGEYNAWNIWNSQGQQPSTTAAISAAKRMNFEGLRISKSRNFYPSVTSYKRMLDSGRPIYFASDVDGSWNGASRGNAALSCRGSTGAHAYTIVGYDDSNQKFVIKNSWGDYWGDQGYGYLPYSCIRRMNDYGYDIEVN